MDRANRENNCKANQNTPIGFHSFQTVLKRIIFFLFLSPVIGISQTNIEKGEIQSTTWTKLNSPYYINSTVTVPKMNTLIIEDGVEIYLEASIKVEGEIIAVGSINNPIRFIGNKANSLMRIELKRSSKSKLEHCIIENMYDGLRIEGCTPIVENTTIKNCSRYAVYCIGASPIIRNSLLVNSQVGIRCETSSPTLDNCNVLFNSRFGLIVNNSKPQINNSILWGNTFLFEAYRKIFITNSIVQSAIDMKNKSLEDLQDLKESNIVGLPQNYQNFNTEIYNNNYLSLSINHNSISKQIGIKRGEVKVLEKEIVTQEVDEEMHGPNLYTEKISDVDVNIPNNNKVNDYRFALIIGNEDYTKYQTNLTSEVNVDFAIHDAEIFAKYCKNLMGVPEQNIILLKNAIGTEIKREVNKLSKMMMYTQGKAEIIFYYAGHGVPNENTKEPYLMPVDVSAQHIEDGVQLSWLYTKLTEYNSKFVLVFLDACFTGGARNQGLLAARGVKIKPHESEVTGNCVVFTSSSDIQSSLAYKEKKHGMFTYFLLKKLQESKGNITLKELSDYLYENVALNSLKINSKEQTPKTFVSHSLQNSWNQMMLVE